VKRISGPCCTTFSGARQAHVAVDVQAKLISFDGWSEAGVPLSGKPILTRQEIDGIVN
jgi:hypothetical protein